MQSARLSFELQISNNVMAKFFTMILNIYIIQVIIHCYKSEMGSI